MLLSDELYAIAESGADDPALAALALADRLEEADPEANPGLIAHLRRLAEGFFPIQQPHIAEIVRQGWTPIEAETSGIMDLGYTVIAQKGQSYLTDHLIQPVYGTITEYKTRAEQHEAARLLRDCFQTINNNLPYCEFMWLLLAKSFRLDYPCTKPFVYDESYGGQLGFMTFKKLPDDGYHPTILYRRPTSGQKEPIHGN